MVRLVEYLTVLIVRQTREKMSPVQASRTKMRVQQASNQA